MSKKSRNRRAAAVEPPRQAQVQGERQPRQPFASASPGALGSYVGIALGLGLVFLGIGAALRENPLPFILVLALLVAGALEALTCWRALHRSRAGWSFGLALSGTLSLAFLFGSPKIADTLSIPIGGAIIPAAVAVIATILLGMAASDISSRSA